VTERSLQRPERNEVLDAALDYLDRGWQPLPLRPGDKRPVDRKWQTLKITATNAGRYFAQEGNIGVQLGSRSGGLVDVDLDCPEAVALADALLSSTPAIFGRRSKPKSHRLYKTDLCEMEKRAVIKYQLPKNLGGGVLVELRVGSGDKGAQTMVPPSRHPSGEVVQWASDGEPTEVDGSVLARCVAALAVGALLVRCYPAEGSRHDAALVVGGVLARVPGMDGEDIERFVTAIAQIAGDEEAAERGRSAAGAVALLARGDPTPGMPRFREVWGVEVATCVGKWLGVPAGDHAVSQDEQITARIAELARLSGIDYDRKRKEVAGELGIRKSTLDKAVEEQRSTHAREVAAPSPPDLRELAALSSEIIASKDVVGLFVKQFERMIAGEVKNAKLLYLIGTSRLFDKAMHAAVKGPSSGGKTDIRNSVLNFMPPEAVISFTALSEKALLYTTEGFEHKILSMGEALTGKETEFQDAMLRQLMSDNVLRYQVPQKIDGEIRTITIEKRGPVAFMVTTTKNKLHPENETRMLSLEVDDSHDQTRAVLRKVANVVGYNQGAVQIDFEPWHNFQRWLAAGETRVVVPFARTLLDMIPPKAVRLRRDAAQLLLAIKAHALIHRHHRKLNERGEILATSTEDYPAVYALMADVMATAAEVKTAKQIEETIAAVGELQPDQRTNGVTIRPIAARLRLDRSATQRRLWVAVNAGCVENVVEAKGSKGAQYRTTGEEPPMAEILPTPEELRAELGRRARAGP
jgi:hypothetical protein